MSSRAKRFAVMALAVVLALALVAGMALAFGGTRSAYAATDVLTLDFDGTQVTMDAESQVDADDYLGLFSNNDGSTKLAYTSGLIEVGGMVKLTLAEPVSAAEYPTIRIRIFVATVEAAAGEIVTTVYAASDAEFAAPLASAGVSADTGMGGEIILTVESAKLADQSGNVQSVVLKRTGVAEGQYFFDYVQCIPLAEPQETLTVDFDGAAATLAEYPGNVCADNDQMYGVFGGKGETKMMYSNAIASGGTVTVQFGVPFAAEDYATIDLQMAVGNWWVVSEDGSSAIQIQTVVSAYNSADKEFTKPAAMVEVTESANKVVTLTMKSADLADDDGIVRSFVLRRVEDGQKTSGNLFFDYMQLYTKQDVPDTKESKYFEAGTLITGANPAGIKDDNVTWLKFRDHPKFDSYGLNEHNALSDIKTKSEFATAIKDCPTYTVGSLEAVRANKLVWALDAGGLDAANYAQVEITLFFTDWCTPSQHQFYVYGSGTTSFTNASGEAEGYAAEFTTNNPSQMYTIKIDNVADLADENGEIGYIYILWWGNTLDTEDEIVGTFNGTQFWLNNVNFLIQEDVESPIKSEEYIEKDLSELLPVGDGVAFDLVSNGATSDEEGYGAMKTMASVSVDAAYDVTEFTVTPTYTTNFSFYIVFKAPSATTTYDVGGITLWIAADNTLIASSAGEGKYAMVAQKVAADYNGAFASGRPTKVRMEMIPGYLEGVQSGYFLYVYLNDGEEAFLSGYIENADVSLGDYINIMYQDLGSDYSVVFGSASDTPTAAADVMEVTVSTNSGSTEFTTPRAKLNLDHMQVEGEQVSDLIIEGDATYNAENGFLTFNSNGTVKVHYTVTNAFGTFTSNTLELTYTGAGGTDGGDDNGGGLTTGAIVGIVVAAVVVVAAAIAIPAVIVRKKKNAK